jgi:hypothetical protein
MTKKRNIHLKVLLLLLTYLVSNVPFALFHHHEDEIVAFSEASPCEKSIHYQNAIDSCDHDAHVFEYTEKCLLCDHHIVTPHVLIAQFIVPFYALEKEILHTQIVTDFIFQTSYIASNKGPPTV